MSHPGQGGDRNDPSKPESSSPAAADDQRSGRIIQDERGNSVWEWKLETGVYSRDINTQRLKKLEFNDLSIAETAKHQRPPGLGGDQEGAARMPGGGFNPYDNSSTAGGNVGGNPYNSGGRAPLKSQPIAAEPHPAEPKQRKPMDLKKLQEWMEIRKRVQENKQDDGDDE
jgi:hypothetical protein